MAPMKTHSFLYSLLMLPLALAAETRPSHQPKDGEGLNYQVYDNNVYGEVDFTYWYVSQQGNDYASTGSYLSFPTGRPALANPGGIYSPNSSAEPGFKVALGVNTDSNYYDLMARYTWLYSSQKNRVDSTNLESSIVPLFLYDVGGEGSIGNSIVIVPSSSRYVTTATADWTLRFNVLDLELGRSFFDWRCMTLRPSFGLKGSIQSEDLKLRYVVSSSYGENDVSCRQSFWGVGPRLGLDGTWNISPAHTYFTNSPASLHVLTNLAGSALFSAFTVKAQSYDTITSLYTKRLIADQINRVTKMTPVLESLLGLEIRRTYENQSRLSLSAAWENQVWFYMNQHSSSIADISLTLSGLTLRARYDY